MIQSTEFKAEAPICWSPSLQALQKDRHNNMQSDALQVKDVYSGFGQGYVQDAFQKVSILMPAILPLSSPSSRSS